MIKNERQFRITKTQAERFRSAVRALEAATADAAVHPILRKAEIDGLRSQLADLEAELREYQDLRSGRRKLARVQTFEDLPRALVQARIAGGLTQEQLAARLKLKSQQIQRYEATEYQSASLSRVSEVASALGVKVSKDILSPGAESSIPTLVDRLTEVGLQKDFILRRLLPTSSLSLVDQVEPRSTEVAVEAVEALGRIYGWSPAILFGGEPLNLKSTASAQARFKLPARVRKAGFGAYVIYAHYLALLVLEITSDLERKPLPNDPAVVRQEILAQCGVLDFESALKYVWSLGVSVLALNDAGGFNGACWRVNGRNVIVLRQRTRSSEQWLHDLLHEYFHAAHNQDLEEHPIIEDSEMSEARRKSPEETQASQFAGDVMLAGRAEDLTQQCVDAAANSVERLKAVVPKVAKAADVSVGALANYVAFRLSLQGINWWGAATNLQQELGDVSCTPRDLLLAHSKLGALNPIDRDLLLRALEPLVLAFSGKMGSGKSTLSQQVADALGWKRASFGDYLRVFARSQGLEESREVLQDLGESLVIKDPTAFCHSVLTHFQWHSGEPLVIDGVRHAAVLDSLRKLVAPLELRLVFIEIDEGTRIKRLQKIDKSVLDRLAVVESHSTEREVVSTLPALAAWHVQGDRPVDQVVQEILAWVHQGDGVEDTCIT
jgi:transcriptional regulator with XRE-family HTH domain/Zn-dependent peptidase ImmA (M78 family)/adenylate kinase family enzyme